MTVYKKAIINISIICLTFCVSYPARPSAHAEGLATLAELGKSQDEMEKELIRETKDFWRLKDDIECGLIAKDVASETIEKSYGEPASIVTDANYKERWVYLPGDGSHFGGIKIYLFFDGENKLKGIKVLKR
ncbi:MAG: hypothetical protein JW994_02820 [Candidatus Omnitrophica bacterium]|nr:hypothetical protein [Candidatus Omnitrophota bacterium]